MVLLLERCTEFHIPVWACSLDFRKAFDTVEHSSLWQALLSQEVPALYVRVLAALYSKQTGQVIGRSMSKTFELGRGTKQGDPLSPALFNALLEYVLGPLQVEWRAKSWGISLGSDPLDVLCTLRFADDMIILARSRCQLKQMLHDLLRRIVELGVEVHAGKSKVLCNVLTSRSLQTLKVDNHSFDIVPMARGTMYLGRMLSFGQLHDAEVSNRMSRAWAKFNAHRKELCNKHFHLSHRLRFFQAVITPSALYSAGTWTMTAGRERILRSMQRKMLRIIVNVRRTTVSSGDSTSSSTDDEDEDCEEDDESHLEPWLLWMSRATSLSEEMAQKHGICDWVEDQRRRKWRLA